MRLSLDDKALASRHKQAVRDFTRNRVLTFQVMAILLMAKGMKSLQLSLNEFIPRLGLPWLTVSNAAYSKARAKFRHTAFIELNLETVVRTMYEDGDYRTYKGLRILAVDGSTVMLPTTPETKDVFGSIAYRNNSDKANGGEGENSYARASVLYDVLNHVALDAQFVPCSSYEVDLAANHLSWLQADDLAIYDRGYCSYRMLALASRAHGQFLVRCPRGRFPVATAMLRGEGPDDVTVELHAPLGFEHHSLPTKVTVRFVRVLLDTGEYEVLATSLIDQQMFPLDDFKQLYWFRWGIETFYGVLKTRLGLENFSGLSVESIRQDFYAAVLLTGVESILTEDAEEVLEQQTGGHPKKVNRAVSFNAIKYRAFELFMSKGPQEEVLEELTGLFTANPTLIRKGRKPPRNNSSSHRILGFWKRKRKAVF